MAEFGLASLPDQPRCRAPSKLNEEQREQLIRWAEAEPLCSRELMTRLESIFSVSIATRHCVWKCTRIA